MTRQSIMLKALRTSSVLLIAFTAFPALSQQLNTVVGGGSLARECYDSSQRAARLQVASLADLQLCDRAIFDGALKPAELAATYSNRGVVRMAMKDYKKAYRDYQRAIEIDPALADAYINRGNLWFAMGESQRSIIDYNKAIELGTQQDKVVLLNRGLAYEQMGKLDQARADYEAALALDREWQAASDKLERVMQKILQQ